MSKAVSAEPNGTTGVTDDEQPDEPEERPVTNEGILGLCNDLDWDGVPAVHRRKIRDLLERVTDDEISSFPVNFTKVTANVNMFGDTILTMWYDEGSITDYDLEHVGIDTDVDGFQAWADRTAVYLHTDE